jgi:integrase
MAYKYRHRETYKGTKIDLRANTLSELDRKVKAKKKAIDHNTIDGSVSMSRFGTMFLEATKRNTVSASWYQDLCYTWNTIVRQIGDRPMDRISTIQLQEYLNGLYLADGTIKKRYDLICQVFRYAYINGTTETDYTLGLVRPRGTPTVNGRSITDRERSTLLEALNGHRGELLCKLVLYCGLRPSEAQALEWSDIDLVGRTVTVTKSLKRDGTVGTPKTVSAYRVVPIPEHLVPLLSCHQSDGNLFSHNLKWRRRMWDDIRKRTGLTFTLYDLRHTYCTDLEKMGVPISIASRFMGHANINITAKIYTHASTEALEIGRSIIDNVGKNVGTTPPKPNRRAIYLRTGSHEVRGSSPLCSTKQKP